MLLIIAAGLLLYLSNYSTKMKILQLEMRIQSKFMNFLANLKEKEVEFYLENTNFAMNMLLLYDLEETSIEAMGNEIENWGSSETLIQNPLAGSVEDNFIKKI